MLRIQAAAKHRCRNKFCHIKTNFSRVPSRLILNFTRKEKADDNTVEAVCVPLKLN